MDVNEAVVSRTRCSVFAMLASDSSVLDGRRIAAHHSADARAAQHPGTQRQTKNPAARAAGFCVSVVRRNAQCARIASSSSATMLVILIIGLTAGPAVSL